MRRRYRYDADLDAVVEVGNWFVEKPQGPNIIKDDIGAGVNGLRHMASGRHFDSKSAFRQHTKDRGLEEVGNDRMASTSQQKEDYGRVVKEAYDQWMGDWNGTRDQVRKMGG